MSVCVDDPDPLSSESTDEPPSIPQSLFGDIFLAPHPVRRHPSACRIPISPPSQQFLRNFYPQASEAEWSNWHWQIRNSVASLDQIRRMIDLTSDERMAIMCHSSGLPLRITPYYASLISRSDPAQAIRRSMIPVMDEYLTSPDEKPDPLHEEHQSPVPGVVHRYPDRVLFLTTGFCSSYCRYCTRSRMVGCNGKFRSSIKQWQQAISYIEQTPQIRDVLLSGGDPLTLPDSQLEYLLSSIRRISHVEVIRIGTKVPVVLPQRITPKMLRILKKYNPLWMSIHFTHPDELTPETCAACTQLADAGLPLGSQTVLLKGINDRVETLKTLYHGLMKVRVRPYYLYQCDPILGSSHFRTSVETGIEMIEGLRGHTSGYAVPHYVIDAPGGGGKIPLLPDYFQGRTAEGVILRNYEGALFRYPESSLHHAPGA
ncbi:MAG TPA: KamA family radical SAM protein [Deltaproteobacteria bacterium]|nr:KamA family radical SAM protein [Deltaproteobacteria bacterium]